MSVSILLLSLWGRAVVVDTDSLGESLAPLSGSTMVVDFFADWMAAEMLEMGADPVLVEPTVGHLLDSSLVGQALDRLVGDIVAAASSPEPGGSTIDMSTVVAPAIPEVTVGLTELGYPVSQDEVTGIVEGLDPLVIRQPGSAALVGPHSPTAARLGTAAFLALLALIGFGYGFVALSRDRVAAFRTLFNRVAVGALSFALFLRLGSWVLDPRGGRAPVRESLSSLAGSSWLVPLEIALVAAVVSAGAYLARRLVKRREGSLKEYGPTTPREERARSLSASR